MICCVALHRRPIEGVACFGNLPIGGSLHLIYLRFALSEHYMLRTTPLYLMKTTKRLFLSMSKELDCLIRYFSLQFMTIKEIDMTKIMKLFFLMLMFVAFDLFGIGDNADLEKYRLYVTMVDPEFHCFALSNNLVFHIPKKNWETDCLPSVGSEVYIESLPRIIEGSSYDEQGDFNVFSSDQKKPNPVLLTKDSAQYCLLSYDSFEQICSQPAGWIVRAFYQNILTLSDGSKWVRMYDGPDTSINEEFIQGDRIILSKLKDDEYVIINIDRTRFIISKYEMYRTTVVKPYDLAEIVEK